MSRYASIDENRAFSENVVGEVRAAINEQKFDHVLTVAIAGSFGRLEACEASDADVIIVLNDESLDGVAAGDLEDVRAQSEAAVIEGVRDAFEAHGIAPPNPKGVFAQSRSLNDLLPPEDEGGLGTPSEATDVMGKRLLLLLESRYLWNEVGYERTIGDIFERYSAYVVADQTKEHLYLLNDLIRYFRYICVNYQSTFGNEKDKWAIRNLKLRHSRLVMYAGTLTLLGHASQFRDGRKVSEVREGLALTPLDRLRVAYDGSEDYSFYKISGLYNSFLMQLSDPSLRTDLNALDYDQRYQHQVFATLKANSDAFQSELANFIYRRRGQWSDRFFEYLLL